MNRWAKAAIVCGMGVFLMGLAGCGGGDDGGSGTGGDAALVGDWRMTAMSVNGSGYFAPGTIGWDIQIRLNEDGTARATEVWRGSTESGGGGWSAGGGVLNLDVGSYDWTGGYVARGNQFTLSNVPDYDGEGDLGSFVFTRQ